MQILAETILLDKINISLITFRKEIPFNGTFVISGIRQSTSVFGQGIGEGSSLIVSEPSTSSGHFV